MAEDACNKNGHSSEASLNLTAELWDNVMVRSEHECWKSKEVVCAPTLRQCFTLRNKRRQVQVRGKEKGAITEGAEVALDTVEHLLCCEPVEVISMDGL